MTTRGRQRLLGSIVYHMADDDDWSSRTLCYQYLRGWVGATSEIYADVNVLKNQVFRSNLRFDYEYYEIRCEFLFIPEANDGRLDNWSWIRHSKWFFLLYDDQKQPILEASKYALTFHGL